RFGLGCAFLGLGMRDRAVEEWGRCVEISPSCGYAHYALAWIYYNMGDRERGYEHVSKAMDSGDSLDKIKEIIELITGEKMQITIEKDVADYDKEIDVDEQDKIKVDQEKDVIEEKVDVDHLYQKGVEALREGKVDEGVELLEQAVSSEHGRPDIYFELGRAYSLKGKWSQAIEEWRKTVELDPDYKDVQYFMTNAEKILKREENILTRENEKEKPPQRGDIGELVTYESLKKISIYLLIFIIVAFFSRNFLTKGYLIGWDSMSHVFKTWFTMESLAGKSQFDWCEYWYMGSPIMPMYGPLY
ncbi:MAG: tetratricopeptide repeat protein, partial [Methanomassiliicoccales archaeon]